MDLLCGLLLVDLHSFQRDLIFCFKKKLLDSLFASSAPYFSIRTKFICIRTRLMEYRDGFVTAEEELDGTKTSWSGEFEANAHCTATPDMIVGTATTAMIDNLTWGEGEGMFHLNFV